MTPICDRSFNKSLTYNGNFAPKLVLDFPFFNGLRSLLLDNLEQLLDTHDCGQMVTVPKPIRSRVLKEREKETNGRN